MSVPDTLGVPLAALPETRAATQPDAAAIADEAVALDNAAFADRVARAAALLARLGVGPGDVVAIALPNRLELIISLFAAWRLGAAATPVNPALTPAEMQYQVDDAGAKLVIGEGLDLDAAVVEPGELAEEPSLHAEPVAVDPAALALLIYTSGTTGKPKGVMLDHANLAAMCDMTRAGLGITAADHSLLILPLFHVNGIIVGTLTPLLAGGRVTVAGRFSPKTFFGLVERIRPTYFSAVPAIYAMLTSMPEADDGRHVVAAARRLRRGADAHRADRSRREHPRRRARRGLRAVRGLVRLDAQPLRRRAQARHGRAAAAGAGGPRRRPPRATAARRASAARS